VNGANQIFVYAGNEKVISLEVDGISNRKNLCRSVKKTKEKATQKEKKEEKAQKKATKTETKKEA